MKPSPPVFTRYRSLPSASSTMTNASLTFSPSISAWNRTSSALLTCTAKWVGCVAILTLDKSKFVKSAKVNTVELLSMLTPNGKSLGVMFWQLLQSFTGVGIIAPWNSLSGQASWSGHDRRTGYSPLGGEGMYSDWAVTELFVTLYTVSAWFQSFSEKYASDPNCCDSAYPLS